MYYLQVLEANERKVGRVRFKPIENEPVELEAKGISRLFSTKVVKRKKKQDKDHENDERSGDEITSSEDLDSIYLRGVQIQKRFEDTDCYAPDDDKEDDHVGNYKH